MLHDIASDYSKALLYDHVEVSEKPLVLTFKATEKDRVVCIAATTSPADTLWLLFTAILASGALALCLPFYFTLRNS